MNGPLRGASRETLDTMERMNKRMEALEAKEKSAETDVRKCYICGGIGHIYPMIVLKNCHFTIEKDPKLRHL